MATYVNDLRLKEITTGDESGTWGTSTNTNLELIAEAFSYGTEVITTNADTHTTTIADGATDPGRSLYLKYTGTLDSACTITIGPNTVSKVWIIENGTSGSQNIIISQGSGANITIPAGDTKVVYSDGAGAGAAFFDAFASLSVVDLKVQDDLTVTDDASIGGDATITGTLGVTGNITGTLATAAQPNITSVGTLTGLTTTGDINFGDDDKAIFGAGSDLQIYHSGSNSYITDSGTGSLYVQGSSNILLGSTTQSNLIIADGGAVTARYAGNNKLATTATGIDVTGAVDADKLSIDTGATNVTIDSGGIYNSLNTTGVTYVVSDTNAAAGLFAYGTAHATKPSTVEIKAGGSVRATITSTGNVGIGTTSPDNKVNIQESALSGRDASNGNTSLTLEHATDTGIQFFSATQTQLRFGDAASTGAGSIIYEHGTDKLRLNTGAITSFETGGSERMRIGSNGHMLVNTTTDYGQFVVETNVAGGNPAGLYIYSTDTVVDAGNVLGIFSYESDATVGDGTYFLQFKDADGVIGSITSASSSSAVAFNTSSDERLKENIIDASPQLDIIKQVQVREFDWKKNGNHQVGMIAQELNNIIPEVVTVGGESESENPWAVDYGKLTPYLIKAIQEQQTLIESLTARITALES
jgi:hypothetical protein